jgi:glycosyltransferase 2 family protein
VLVAAVATVGNALLAGMMWRRVLADLGSRLPVAVAARVFFVGQLGKYLPGSVWPMLVQAELGSDHGVPRRRTAAAGVVAILLAGVSGVAVMAASAPFLPHGVPTGPALAVLGAGLLAVVVLHPAVLGPVLDAGLRLVGREPLGQPTTVRGTLAATGWAVASWLCAGVQVFILALPLGAPATVRTFALMTGGYVLAWCVGFVVVLAPAGAGARELALAAVLAGTLDRGAVVVVVLVSRVLFTAVDLALAGAGLGVGRRGAGRLTPRSAPGRRSPGTPR